MALPLVAIGAGLWLKKNAKWIILTLIILIAIFVIGRILKRGRPPRDKEQLPGDIGGEVPTNWYPDDITDELFDIIDGFDSVYKKDVAATKFNQLLDNQKILVYNDWNQRFSLRTTWLGDAFGSLTQAVRDELDKGPQMIIMQGNLNRLKLP